MAAASLCLPCPMLPLQAAKVERILEWLEVPTATSEVDLATKVGPGWGGWVGGWMGGCSQ